MKRGWKTAGMALAMLGLMFGASLAQQTQTAPAKGPVEVTYYFLPG